MYVMRRHFIETSRSPFKGRTRPILIDASLEATALDSARIRKGFGLKDGFDAYSISLGLSPDGRLRLVPGRGLRLSLLNNALPSQGVTAPAAEHHFEFEQLLTLMPTAHFQIDVADTSPILRAALKRTVDKHELLDRICLGSRFDAVGEILVEEFPTVPHFFPRAALATWSFSALLNQEFETRERYTVLNLPMSLENLNLITEELVHGVRAAGLWLNVILPEHPKQRERLFKMNIHGLIFGTEQKLMIKQDNLSPHQQHLKSA